MQDPQGDQLVHEMNIYLITHEMTHTFGFSSSLFPYFIDDQGNKLRGHILQRQLDGETSTVINIPVLTNKLRSFFGCASLAGAFMENDDGDGTASSHFERRQFTFDYMISGLMYELRISEFALAMLEGSGWYAVDYNYAEPYFFGEGEGCGFLMGSCGNYRPELCRMV